MKDPDWHIFFIVWAKCLMVFRIKLWKKLDFPPYAG